MKKWLIGTVLIVIVLVMVVAFSTWNLKRVTNSTYQLYLAKAPYDVIIVPGLPYDSAQSNTLLKVRMFWVKDLFDRGIAKNIIFSGAAVHSPWVEGEVMKILADSLRISPAHTFAETRAEHGNENVYYSIHIARKLGFKKIALATDLYQNWFLSSLMKKKFPEVGLLPVAADSFPVYGKQQLPTIDASAAFVKNFIPLKNRESRWERWKASVSDEMPIKQEGN